MCLRVDIFCDVTFLKKLGLVRKKDGAYETTKKADEFLELVYELLKADHKAEAVAES
jgi:predicted transcriptional regulator